MKKLLQAAALSVAALLSATSNATLVEFDTSPLLMDDVIGGTGLYNPTGTFTFDTNTLAVDFVNVTTPHANYVSGVYDSNSEAFGLFTTSGVNGLVLDITVIFSEILAEISGLSAGDSFFVGADPFEYDNSDGTSYGIAVDPGLSGTILAAVPLPASLPLLLTGLGSLPLVMRRRKAKDTTDL